MLIDDLQALVMNQPLPYNKDGVGMVRSQIIATSNNAKSQGFIDGLVSITIPDEYYVNNEASLSVGDKAILAAKRQTKKLDDIVVKFKWDSEITEIRIKELGI
jgi:hypothetical protein